MLSLSCCVMSCRHPIITLKVLMRTILKGMRDFRTSISFCKVDEPGWGWGWGFPLSLSSVVYCYIYGNCGYEMGMSTRMDNDNYDTTAATFNDKI